MSTRRKAKAARFYQPPNKARPSTGPSEVQQLMCAILLEWRLATIERLVARCIAGIDVSSANAVDREPCPGDNLLILIVIRVGGTLARM